MDGPARRRGDRVVVRAGEARVAHVDRRRSGQKGEWKGSRDEDEVEEGASWARCSRWWWCWLCELCAVRACVQVPRRSSGCGRGLRGRTEEGAVGSGGELEERRRRKGPRERTRVGAGACPRCASRGLSERRGVCADGRTEGEAGGGGRVEEGSWSRERKRGRGRHGYRLRTRLGLGQATSLLRVRADRRSGERAQLAKARAHVVLRLVNLSRSSKRGSEVSAIVPRQWAPLGPRQGARRGRTADACQVRRGGPSQLALRRALNRLRRLRAAQGLAWAMNALRSRPSALTRELSTSPGRARRPRPASRGSCAALIASDARGSRFPLRG